jgi:hypothetical protein
MAAKNTYHGVLAQQHVVARNPGEHQEQDHPHSQHATQQFDGGPDVGVELAQHHADDGRHQ